MSKRKLYESDGIRVSYEPARCIHAAECVHGLGAVFDPDRRPWIKPDEATADEVARVVAQCPTGALGFERLDGGPAEQRPRLNTVSARSNGPLYLRGDLHLKDPDGEGWLACHRLALCRCGKSQAKPHCDNSHREAGFAAPGAEGVVPAPAEGEHDEALSITPTPDGPLLVDGPFQLLSDDGVVGEQQRGGAFCRCGQSGNKPDCDGSHVEAGFRSE